MRRKVERKRRGRKEGGGSLSMYLNILLCNVNEENEEMENGEKEERGFFTDYLPHSMCVSLNHLVQMDSHI